jgi:hypothetical protein
MDFQRAARGKTCHGNRAKIASFLALQSSLVGQITEEEQIRITQIFAFSALRFRRLWIFLPQLFGAFNMVSVYESNRDNQL